MYKNPTDMKHVKQIICRNRQIKRNWLKKSDLDKAIIGYVFVRK